MPAASLRDVAVPDRRQPRFLQGAQIRGGVGVIPEHVGAKVRCSAGPLPGSDDREEIAVRVKPATDTREQRPLIRERDVDQGVKATTAAAVGGLKCSAAMSACTKRAAGTRR
jgi:hypothetical protein